MKPPAAEDDRETAAFHSVKGLSERLLTVDQSPDGREGFISPARSYDAIILDRMLPGMDAVLAMLALRKAAEIGTSS